MSGNEQTTEEKLEAMREVFPGLDDGTLEAALESCGGSLPCALATVAEAVEAAEEAKREAAEALGEASSAMLGSDAHSSPIVVRWLGGDQNGPCGYCNATKDGRKSWGMTVDSIEAADYQELIDLGWRRSGKYLYKPNNPIACCPQYVIR